jgi:GTPase
VIFDFAPQIEIGAEILSRRGEDQRLTEERPAARRRRERDRAYHAADEVADDVEPDSGRDDA